MRIGEKSMRGLDCTLNGGNVIYYYASQQNLHENCAQLTLQAKVFFRSGSQMRFVCVEFIKLFFCLFQGKVAYYLQV